MIKNTYLAAVLLVPACLLGYFALRADAPAIPPPHLAVSAAPTAAPAPQQAPQASNQFFAPVIAAPKAQTAPAPAPLLPSAKKIRPVGYGIAQAQPGTMPAQRRAGDSVGARAGDSVGKRAGDQVAARPGDLQ